MNITYILLAYLALFSLGIIDNSRGPIYPEVLKLFSITKSQGSILFSLSSLSGFVISVFSNRWLKVLGSFNATRISLALDAIACLLMGTVGSGLSGFYQFLVAMIILGIAMGIKGITLNLMINHASPPLKRRQIYGGLHSMYGIASLASPLIFGFIFKYHIDWKYYFLILSLLPLSVLIYSFKEKDLLSHTSKKAILGTWNKEVIKYSAVFLLYVASEILISSRLVIYLNEVHAFAMEYASYGLSGFFFFLLIGRLIISFRTINISSFHLLNLSLIFSLIITILGITVYAPLLALNGLSMSVFFPTGMDWLSEISKDEADHIISKVMISVSGGLVVMHYGFGLLSDLLGLGLSMWIVPVMLMISLYLLQTIPNKVVASSSSL